MPIFRKKPILIDPFNLKDNLEHQKILGKFLDEISKSHTSTNSSIKNVIKARKDVIYTSSGQRFQLSHSILLLPTEANYEFRVFANDTKSKNPRDFLHKNRRILGAGNFGRVYKTKVLNIIKDATGNIHKVNLGETRVLKKLTKALPDASLTEDSSNIETEIKQEIENTNKIGLSISGVAKKTVKSKDKYYIDMSKVKGENLRSLISSANPSLSTEQRFQITIQLLQDLQKIHAQKVIHRDLKPENILVDLREGKITSTIIDLGLAVPEGTKTTVGGTLSYVASDILVQIKANKSYLHIYDYQSDIFSLAVTLSEVWEGKNIYIKYSCPEKLEAAAKGIHHFSSYFGNTETNFKDLNQQEKDAIKECLNGGQAQHENRFSLEQILESFKSTYKQWEERQQALLESIKKQDADGNTVLHLNYNNPVDFFTTSKLNDLSQSHYLEALQVKNNAGNTVLHVAINNHLSLDILNDLTPAELLVALKEKNNAGESVLHCAISNYESLKVIQEVISKKLTLTQCLELFRVKNNAGKTALDLAIDASKDESKGKYKADSLNVFLKFLPESDRKIKNDALLKIKLWNLLALDVLDVTIKSLSTNKKFPVAKRHELEEKASNLLQKIKVVMNAEIIEKNLEVLLDITEKTNNLLENPSKETLAAFEKLINLKEIKTLVGKSTIWKNLVGSLILLAGVVASLVLTAGIGTVVIGAGVGIAAAIAATGFFYSGRERKLNKELHELSEAVSSTIKEVVPTSVEGNRDTVAETQDPVGTPKPVATI